MRKITANIIYPVSSKPITNAYLVIDNSGKIVDICSYNKNSEEIAGLEYYSGILVPGFVNAHCHTELSHLKGTTTQGKGLNSFIKHIQANREEGEQVIEKHIYNALRYMWSRGINGIGDVVNSSIGISKKSKLPILIHNFIELFNKDNTDIFDIVKQGKSIEHAYNNSKLKNSCAPHSMYGTSVDLLKLMCKVFDNNKATTLHFLESKQEINLNNKVIDYLLELKTVENILLVHNLFLNSNILNKIKSHIELYDKIFWVLCPNSNMFIESKLPPIDSFYKWNLKCCLGTDSLASNHQLSILDEMKTITNYYPQIPFSTLLQWATINGAKALNFDKILGSFTNGKTPGVLLLTNFNFKNQQITHNTEVKRLV